MAKKDVGNNVTRTPFGMMRRVGLGVFGLGILFSSAGCGGGGQAATSSPVQPTPTPSPQASPFQGDYQPLLTRTNTSTNQPDQGWGFVPGSPVHVDAQGNLSGFLNSYSQYGIGTVTGSIAPYGQTTMTITFAGPVVFQEKGVLSLVTPASGGAAALKGELTEYRIYPGDIVAAPDLIHTFF